MSKGETGDRAIGAAIMTGAQSQLADMAEPDPRQMDLLDPIGPEDMLEARQAAGARSSNMDVLKVARERRRGRPAGSRNKRTDDFARYLLQFGHHPAITLMQIQSTPPEVLVENSRRLRQRRRTATGIEVDVMQTMSYEAAQSLRVRCADILMPFMESKRPVAIDMSFSGVADLIIEGVTHSRQEIADLVEAEFAPVDDDDLDNGGGS